MSASPPPFEPGCLLDQAEAALLQALHAVRVARNSPAAPALDAPCDVLEVDEAARLAGRSKSTIRKWAKAQHLGRRLGGRWLLSRSRFAGFINGGPT